MKLGKIKFILFFFFISNVLAEDRIFSTPIINLENLKPSYESSDNENEIEMIKITDYPCLVKNENFDGSLINIDNLIKSDEPSPRGWSDVIKTALQKI